MPAAKVFGPRIKRVQLRERAGNDPPVIRRVDATPSQRGTHAPEQSHDELVDFRRAVRPAVVSRRAECNNRECRVRGGVEVRDRKPHVAIGRQLTIEVARGEFDAAHEFRALVKLGLRREERACHYLDNAAALG